MIFSKLQTVLVLNEAKERNLLQILDDLGGTDSFTKSPSSFESAKSIDFGSMDDGLKKRVISTVDIYNDSEVWNKIDVKEMFSDTTLPVLFIVKHLGKFYMVFTSGGETAKYIALVANFYL